MGHHINGEIATDDWTAIAGALGGWADRCIKKEDLLVRKGSFSASIYADGDHFLVSAVVDSEAREDAEALLAEFVARLDAAGLPSSLEM